MVAGNDWVVVTEVSKEVDREIAAVTCTLLGGLVGIETQADHLSSAIRGNSARSRGLCWRTMHCYAALH